MMQKGLKIIGVIFCIFMIIIPVYANSEYTNIEAKVVENNGKKEIKQDNDVVKEVQDVTIRILEGDYENEEHNVEYVLSENKENENSKDELSKDNRVLVNIEEEEGEISSITIQEIVRTNDLWLPLAVLIVLLLLIGGKKGIKPIIICALVFLIIFFVFFGGLSKGWNSVLMSIITAVAINIVVSIGLNGIGNKSFIVALSSTIEALICGAIALGYFKLTKLSGEILNISIFKLAFNIKELLYSGAILSSCGFSLYISTQIANYLESLKKEDKNTTWKQLFKLGLKEGIEKVTNIIYIPMLLYLCSAITLMVVEIENSINNETMIIMISYLINVCIGAVIIVPIISFLYAFLNRNKIFYKMKSDNIIEGQRSLKL